ncbi:hypothetical protein L218DRAFT_1009011 [Marasmius fiardii PR-910]|nr:hypothetical protein L218DRAFT_1009011 [Marasmius fiardii PR-910]
MNIVEIPILVSISAAWLTQAIMGFDWNVNYLGEEDYTHFDYLIGKRKSRENKVWLVQAYYAEYFRKKPQRDIQPVQYGYYTPTYPHYFQPHVAPGVPPMMYAPNTETLPNYVSPFQVDPFILPSADPGSTTNKKSSPQHQVLTHRQAIVEMLTTDANNLSLQPGLAEQPTFTSGAPIIQLPHYTFFPPNSPEAQMNIAELNSRVDMLTREVRRMERQLSPLTYNTTPSIFNSAV